MTLEIWKRRFDTEVRDLQDKITQELKAIDPDLVLEEDRWNRTDFRGNPGGGGITRAFRGKVFENAGVNTSLIHGSVDPAFAKGLVRAARGEGSEHQHQEEELWACGISLIIHPVNPRVPSVHANFRMIHAGKGSVFWFGGGADLTPYYPYEEDFVSFHRTWEKACRPYGCYARMKKDCDQYFVNHHRQGEMRGVGGLFFDHFSSGDVEKDLNQVIDLARHFIPSYFPLVEKRKDESYSAEDEDFQLHRRGRYVEFNLLHDRGTAFGLKSNGRTDSILISLPARCKFTYKYRPPEGSLHEKMLGYYYPRDYVLSAGNPEEAAINENP